MDNLSNAGLIKELVTLRKHLEPVLNNHFLEILKETERRLSGETVLFKEKKPQQGKRITKRDLIQKYL